MYLNRANLDSSLIWPTRTGSTMPRARSSGRASNTTNLIAEGDTAVFEIHTHYSFTWIFWFPKGTARRPHRKRPNYLFALWKTLRDSIPPSSSACIVRTDSTAPGSSYAPISSRSWTLALTWRWACSLNVDRRASTNRTIWTSCSEDTRTASV